MTRDEQRSERVKGQSENVERILPCEVNRACASSDLPVYLCLRLTEIL